MLCSIDLSSEEGRQKRYDSIDLMKFVCAILVVAIHVPPFEMFSPIYNIILVDYIARLAVPLYFVAGGYFLFRKTQPEDYNGKFAQKYALRILKIYILWEAIYCFPIIYLTIIREQKDFLFGILECIRDFLFVGYRQLWYLRATVVAVFILSFLLKSKVGVRTILLLGAVLYGVGLLGQTYFGAIRLLQDIPVIWNGLKLAGKIMKTTRNGLFEGVLFMGMGIMFAYRPIRMRFSSAAWGSVISLLLLLAEVLAVEHFQLYREKDIYICLVPAAFFLFYLITQAELKHRAIYGGLRTIGMLLYLIHTWVEIVVRQLLNIVFGRLGWEGPGSLLCFGTILSISLVVAVFIHKLSQRRRWEWLTFLYR